MNPKVSWLRLPSLRAFLLQLGLALTFVFGSSITSGTPLLVLIDNTSDTPTVSFSPEFKIYSPTLLTSPGRATLTGGLTGGSEVDPAKRAVVLLGFKDDIILLDGTGFVDASQDPNEQHIIQFFTLEFYSDPQGLGFDPAALLDGYSTTFLSKTVPNTCPYRGNCLFVDDGDFGLAGEFPGGVAPFWTLISVRTALLPEPGTALLLASGLLALGLANRRRNYRHTKLSKKIDSLNVSFQE